MSLFDLRRVPATVILTFALGMGLNAVFAQEALAQDTVDDMDTAVETVVTNDEVSSPEVAVSDEEDSNVEEGDPTVVLEETPLDDSLQDEQLTPTTDEADGQELVTDEKTGVEQVSDNKQDDQILPSDSQDLPGQEGTEDENVVVAGGEDADREAEPTAEDEGAEATDEQSDSDLLLNSNLKATDSKLNGVDISGWNTKVNLSTLTGDFVIIKATEYNPDTGTYTSYTTGNTEANYSSYTAQAQAALSAGKLLGFYHFATNPSMGASYTQQAQGFLDAVKNYIGQAMLVLDWENASYSNVESDTNGAKQFLDYIYNKTGIKPLIYMNHSCSNNYDWSNVVNAGYELWGAMYYTMDTAYGYSPNTSYSDYGDWGAWGARPTIYQYSATTILPGSGEHIDVNVFYGTKNDWQTLAGNPWIESNGDYYYLGNGQMKASTWVVTSVSPKGAYSGLQRYWIDSEGKLAVNRLVTASEAGYYAYARPEGYVVRGAYTTGDKIYLADNNGKLANVGWLVSNAFGHGTQRYYIDPTSHAAIAGYSPAGWDHFTRPEGYVVRGRYVARNGYVYLANNDGKLEKTGWLVSNKYGQGLQRYYIDETAHAAIEGFSSNGGAHYTRPEGYVVRGVYTTSAGVRYMADNNGRLTSGKNLVNGWLITSEFGHGLQRYWVENNDIVFGKLIQVDSVTWTYARPEGYVVRGRYTAPNGYVYLANNDGKLENTGWLVSNKYGQGLQRYYIDATAHAAVPGYSIDGYAHFTRKEGYVLRGTVKDGNDFRSANNDGKINDGWVITSNFGQGLQRYWQQGGKVLRNSLINVSSNKWAYARPEGYVVRGKYIASDGLVYLANNDGILENPGWVISQAYGDGFQRYYIEESTHAAKPGYSTSSWTHYTLPAGYVLRNGSYIYNKQQYKANNDGKLTVATTASSAVTAAANSTAAPASGLGFEWVRNVLVKAGLLEAKDFDEHAAVAYGKYCTSTDTNALKVGMIVVVPSSTKATRGVVYGHAAIYIGNGKVMQCDGSVSTMTLTQWKNLYGTTSTPKWGWLMGVALS